jgi:hypothetical protein
MMNLQSSSVPAAERLTSFKTETFNPSALAVPGKINTAIALETHSAIELAEVLPFLNNTAEYCMAVSGVILAKLLDTPSYWKNLGCNTWHEYCTQHVRWHQSTVNKLTRIYSKLVKTWHFSTQEYLDMMQVGWTRVDIAVVAPTREEFLKRLKSGDASRTLNADQREHTRFSAYVDTEQMYYIQETLQVAYNEAGVDTPLPDKPSAWGSAIYHLCIRYNLQRSLHEETE